MKRRPDWFALGGIVVGVIGMIVFQWPGCVVQQYRMVERFMTRRKRYSRASAVEEVEQP